MPQHKSAEKRIRQDEKKRQRNRIKRSKMKTAIKKVKEAPDKETAEKELVKTVSLLDRLAVKGIIHPNKAANIKSKLQKKVNGQ
jgi:small subunit ribosomal protein S20